MAWTEKAVVVDAPQAGGWRSKAISAERAVPKGMTPEQFSYQQQRAAGQMPAPLEVAPVDPLRAAIEDRVMRLGMTTPEQQFKLGQLSDERFSATIDPGGAGALGRGVGQGLSFGLMDEGSAALRGLFTGDYGKALEEQRLSDDVARYARPKTMLAGEVAGSIALPGVGGAKLASAGAGLGAKVVRGAVAGAGSGAAYGFGTGEGGAQERLSDAASGAVIGGAFGGAAPALGALMRGVGQKVADSSAGKAALKLAPSADELRTMAGKIFAKADETGMPRSDLTAAFPGMQSGAVRAGMDDILTPQSARAVSRIEDAATNPSEMMGFRELDILRRQAQIPAGSTTMPVEAAIGSKLVSGLDDVLENAAPGTAKEVAEARAMWGQLRRSEKVEEAIRRAGDHPSGFAQGIMTEFRTILKNPKKLRGFSEQEQKAMRALTSRISPQSVLSVMGKFGPRMSGNGNVVGTATGTGLGALMGGPIGMAAVPALGTAARVLGDKSAAKKADMVRALVAMGSNAPKAGTAKPKALDSLVQSLLFGAAPIGQSLPDRQMSLR